MGSLDKSQEYVISKFLQRYDYDGVLDILIECGIESGDLYYLLKSKNSLSLLTDFFVSKNFTDRNND